MIGDFIVLMVYIKNSFHKDLFSLSKNDLLDFSNNIDHHIILRKNVAF